MFDTQHEIAADRSGTDVAAAFRPGEWLSLAAAPTFALMALLAGGPGSNPPDMLCGSMQHVSPLTGMGAMYLLMSAFHLAPWLRLLAARRRRRGHWC